MSGGKKVIEMIGGEELKVKKSYDGKVWEEYMEVLGKLGLEYDFE